MKITFDPNNEYDPWATYIVWRHPKFRTHAKRAQALNAFGNAVNGILYRYENGRWNEILHVEEENIPKDCEHCGTPFDGKGRNSNRCILWSREKGKITDPPGRVYVCDDCARFYR